MKRFKEAGIHLLIQSGLGKRQRTEGATSFNGDVDSDGASRSLSPERIPGSRAAGGLHSLVHGSAGTQAGGSGVFNNGSLQNSSMAAPGSFSPRTEWSSAWSG
ncbi:MAG: hypothetical protein KA324_12250 [Rubrivivax sp.]|nr:hypothetical protein [Rubrivivax sp.]